MTLDNMTGITKESYTVNDMFCRSQLITCNRVKECNGVCPFADALKHADKMQTMNEKHTVDHDRDWIIGCIEHDGFIHTDRFDKANQIILEALSADRPTWECKDCTHWDKLDYEAPRQGWCYQFEEFTDADEYCSRCAKMRGDSDD